MFDLSDHLHHDADHDDDGGGKGKGPGQIWDFRAETASVRFGRAWPIHVPFFCRWVFKIFLGLFRVSLIFRFFKHQIWSLIGGGYFKDFCPEAMWEAPTPVNGVESLDGKAIKLPDPKIIVNIWTY